MLRRLLQVVKERLARPAPLRGPWQAANPSSPHCCCACSPRCACCACCACLAKLQVPLQDRSTREAPAGGFTKGSM